MQRTSLVIVGLLSIVCIMAWHVPSASGQATHQGWVTLFDGKTSTMSSHRRRELAAGGRRRCGRQGQRLSGLEESYADFQIRVEFWADDEANSGIFIRCADPEKIRPTIPTR